MMEWFGFWIFAAVVIFCSYWSPENIMQIVDKLP